MKPSRSHLSARLQSLWQVQAPGHHFGQAQSTCQTRRDLTTVRQPRPSRVPRPLRSWALHLPDPLLDQQRPAPSQPLQAAAPRQQGGWPEQRLSRRSLLALATLGAPATESGSGALRTLTLADLWARASSATCTWQGSAEVNTLLP